MSKENIPVYKKYAIYPQIKIINEDIVTDIELYHLLLQLKELSVYKLLGKSGKVVTTFDWFVSALSRGDLTVGTLFSSMQQKS